MVKAYDYIESAIDRTSIQSGDAWRHELELARKAVEHAIAYGGRDDVHCPGCGSRKVNRFYVKWSVDYLRCNSCGTIFADASEQAIQIYRTNKELQRYRQSEEYQREASVKRRLLWQEIFDWITFRSMRYLGSAKDLCVYSAELRYEQLRKCIEQSEFCGVFKELSDDMGMAEADIALSLDKIQQMYDPEKHILDIAEGLKTGGLLFLSARMGTGFDVLTLREYAPVYPYEYVTLLSEEGLEKLLQKCGFEVLDYATPGSLDVGYVRGKREYIPEEELFVRTLMERDNGNILGEFQHFLQKSGMSSYARIVARKIVST